MRYLLSIFIALFSATLALADCCDSDHEGRCEDGTEATPCCGYGSCNLWCCRCDGGCRTSNDPSQVLGGRGRRPSWENAQKALTPTADETATYTGLLEVIDKDNSGDVSLGEYLAWCFWNSHCWASK
ncbi:hypothetical protein TWF481_008392 [Arthrobotrys musiformis]|uniref:EF-hand domain-containing protein n=1 Tax=Arthrobotrys musiformis TaxID=47236 RepID=A0AAV9W8U1_9PEZI